MLMITRLLLLFCLAISLPGKSQFNINVDSLKKVLMTPGIPDTTRLMTLAQLGNGYFLRQADSAIFYTRQALILARQVNYPRGEAYALCYYGWSLWSLGAYDKAAETALQAKHIFEALRDEQMVQFM